MRIKVHDLHLKFRIQQQRHAIDTPGKRFPFFRRDLRTSELDKHPVETRMIARDFDFEIGAETSNLHEFASLKQAFALSERPRRRACWFGESRTENGPYHTGNAEKTH